MQVDITNFLKLFFYTFMTRKLLTTKYFITPKQVM